MTRKRTQPSGLSRTPTKSKGSVPNQPWVPVHVLQGPAESLFTDCPLDCGHLKAAHEKVCTTCRRAGRTHENNSLPGPTG